MTVDNKCYYRTLTDADEFFGSQINAEDWTDAEPLDKEKVLLAATRAIDLLKFKGVKNPVFTAQQNSTETLTAEQIAIEDAKQKLQFPRDGQATVSVQTIFKFVTDPTAGTFALTIALLDFGTFTTAGIAFNADAATIQTAIDTAAIAASVPSYTNGDITVSGGTLLVAGADVLLTFDGVSVTGKAHKTPPVVDGSGLTGGSIANPASKANIIGQLPDAVYFGMCEEAIALIGGSDPQQEFENLVLTSDGVSSTRASSDRSRIAQRHTRHLLTSARAWTYIQTELAVSNSFTTKRTS